MVNGERVDFEGTGGGEQRQNERIHAVGFQKRSLKGSIRNPFPFGKRLSLVAGGELELVDAAVEDRIHY